MAKRTPAKKAMPKRCGSVVRIMKERIQRIKANSTRLKQQATGITGKTQKAINELKKTRPNMAKVNETERLLAECVKKAQEIITGIKLFKKNSKSIGVEEPAELKKIAGMAKQTRVAANAGLEILKKIRNKKGL